MPCHQVRTTNLDAPAANVEVMARALAEMGLNVAVDGRTILVTNARGSGQWFDGRLTFNGTLAFDTNALRREYSKQSIKATAKKQGWQLRFKANGQAVATRRRF